jgi:ABC-2 type transport system permease protein
MTPIGLRSTLRNIGIVARREFTWRGQSRAFLISTLFLVVVAIAVALAPTIVRYVNRLDIGETIAVYAGTAAPRIDFPPALQALLASTDVTADAVGAETPVPFKVVEASDLSAARADVTAGKLKAVLALERSPDGDLGYRLYTSLMPFDRTTQLLRQAATALAVQDRLTQAGVAPGDQAALFAPTAFTVEPADATASAAAPDSIEQLIGGSVIGFALTIFIFMAILMYGQWVAMSVAEEKSSRVMEIVLGAAKPFELLTGKVVGVGALGLVQYAAVFLAALLAMLLQGQIASIVLGGQASIDLPSGVTLPVLVAFGIFFVLGFVLYATLFAGIASLVSRQEDVSQLISPLILVSSLGYLVAVYSSSGLIPMDSTVVALLSYVPFLSPYLILARMSMTEVQLWEPMLAIVILAAADVVALWFAARLYAAGVLMYGQKPGFRSLIKALRTA